MSDTPEQALQETPGAQVAPGEESPGEETPRTTATPPPQAAATAAKEPTAAKTADGASDREVAGIEQDLDELVKVGAQRDEYLALAQRTQADFENYRKRVARESALAQERGVVKLCKELLPALDNLDRALDAAAQDDPLLQGVRLVREELVSALARVGVESYSPVGEPFDPSLHEAMAQQPRPDVPSGNVAEVYQAGYRLGEQIIRPARVVVAA